MLVGQLAGLLIYLRTCTSSRGSAASPLPTDRAAGFRAAQSLLLGAKQPLVIDHRNGGV